LNTQDDNNNFEEIITSSKSSEGNSSDNVVSDDKEKSMKSRTKEQPKRDVTGVEKRLWSVAKKYKSLLDKGEVPQVSESEDDRKEVEDAYLELSSNRHWQLDARVYQSLTKMQRTRDAKIALEGTTEKDRLRMIAWEVKTRTQAVIFILGDNTLEMDIFNLHDVSNVRIIEGDAKEILIEDDILESKGIAILDNLQLRKLTKTQKMKLKKEVLAKFENKEFSKEDLNKNLDSLYADLISLMVREGMIILLKTKDNKYRILSSEKAKQEMEEAEFYSISLAITPRKERKES